MENKIRALLIQNRLNSIATLENGLFAEGIICSIEKRDFSSDVITIIEKNKPDVVLISLTDSISESIDLCRKISTNLPEVPIIVLADENDERAALAAMKEGADDYVLFGQIRRLAASISKAIKLHRLQLEIKRARLAEEQARYTLRQTRIAKRLLSEQTFDLVCEILPNGSIAYINKPLGEGLGYSVSELLGKSPLIFVHPEDRPLAIRIFREALEERKGKQMSLRCRHKNGEWRYFHLSGDWIFDDNGNPSKAVVVLRDITDNLKIQEALELSKKYSSSIVNSSLDMIIAADIDRNIIEFNPAAEKTFGYKKEEVLGKPVDILYVDPSMGIEINQILLNKGYCFREVVNVRKNGEKFVSLLSASILKDLNGKMIGIMGISRDISVEKKIQEELERSQSRLKQLVESVNMIPWEVDNLKNRFVYIGKQAEKILGYPAEMWQSSDFWESHIYPEDRNYVINYCLSSAEKFDNFEVEYRMIAANGKVVWLQDIINVERKEGHPVRLRGFMIDITTRKEIEERLRQTNLTLEALINASPLGIIVFDMDGVVQVWNQSAEKILGWESYEIQGKQAPVELVDEIPFNFDKVPAESIESLFYCKEKQLRKKDGNPVYATLWCAPMYDSSESKVTGLIFLIADITDNKQIVEQMQKLANFPRFNPYTVLELDKSGKITYYNDAAMEMTKMLQKEHPSEILPPETPEIVKHCLATGQNWMRMEVKIGDRTISWSFFPIAQNEIVHCYGSDITDRIRLESQLRQSQKMECIGQLAAGVAHDFNNILTIVQGHVGMLLMIKDKFTQAQIDSLQQISMASERGANLTRQLLTFSRRQVIQPKFVDPSEIVSDMSKLIKRLLGETIIERYSFEENLPLVWVDTGMIEQVLMNLAINARDAMPNGGELTISLRSVNIEASYVRKQAQARAGHFVCLSVKDTGIGMDDSVLNHLFEPFFTTKEIGKGTGLGLATVYGIVKQHEGWIEVYSKPEQGSEFRVYLPAYADVNKTASNIQQSGNTLTGCESILLVEDEDPVRELIRNILIQYGYKVFDAANGQDALIIWQQYKNNIDMLITDLIMPEQISGKDLADKLVAEKPDIKVIFISGYSPDIIGEDIEQSTNKFYLQKPFSLQKLIKFVRDCFDAKIIL